MRIEEGGGNAGGVPQADVVEGTEGAGIKASYRSVAHLRSKISYYRPVPCCQLSIFAECPPLVRILVSLRGPLGVSFRCRSSLLELYIGVLLLVDNQVYVCDVTADAPGLELSGLVAPS